MPARVRKEITDFKGLILKDWFSDLDHSSIWLRLYTSLFIEHARFDQAVSELITKLDENQHLIEFGPRLLFAFGTVKDLKIPVMTFDMFAQETGTTTVKVKVDEKELARTNYIFLATPFRVDGKPGNEAEAKRHLDTAAGLICLHTGLNFMRHCVVDGEVSGKDGRFSIPGEAWKMAQRAEGPFLASQNGQDIAEISGSIAALRDPKIGRIRLSLQLMDTAMRKDHGFFEYWTALEVVCNGRTNRIKEYFRKIYGLKNHKEAGEVIGLNVLADWRGKYVHNGITPRLSADIERYIQLMFLDLLRYELSLPARGHIAGIQSAKGYDLSPLGLQDNRTDEQKNAVKPIHS